jgi:hypothetical protein
MINKDDDFIGLKGLTGDDFLDVGLDLYEAADQILSIEKETDRDKGADALIKNPILAIGIVLNARLEKIHFDYLESQHKLRSLLSGLIEHVDCYGARQLEYWMHSDLAAIDKAKELGIDILQDYSMADLRYKIALELREVV